MNKIFHKVALGALAVTMTAGMAGLATNPAHAAENHHSERARHEYENWVAAHPQYQRNNQNFVVTDASFAKQGATVMSQVRDAIDALSADNTVRAKQLLHDARMTMDDMYDRGASGLVQINNQLLVNSASPATSKDGITTQASMSRVLMPFSQTKEFLNIAYTKLVNNDQSGALDVLKNAEANLQSQTVSLVKPAPTNNTGNNTTNNTTNNAS